MTSFGDNLTGVNCFRNRTESLRWLLPQVGEFLERLLRLLLVVVVGGCLEVLLAV